MVDESIDIEDYNNYLDDDQEAILNSNTQELNFENRMIRSLGKLVEVLPVIPMTASLERVSFELQMRPAIIIEKKVAMDSAKANIPSNTVWSENKNRIDPAEIIRRGLAIFEEQHPDIKIVYKTPEYRTGEVEFLKSVGKYVNEKGKLPGKIELRNIFLNDTNMPEVGHVSADRMVGEVETSKDLYNYFMDQGEVKQEDLFAKALELTNGHVFNALDMIAETTKATIRPTYEEIDKPGMSVDEHMLALKKYFDSLKTRLPDQLSDFVNFQSLSIEEPKDANGKIIYDYSYQNRLGQIYHMWDIIKLTQQYTPEMIRVMVTGEYAIYLKRHGHLKLLSDLRVCADLYKIQELFRKEAVRNV